MRSSKRTAPSAATSMEPKGWSPASRASFASSTQRRRCCISDPFTINCSSYPCVGSIKNEASHYKSITYRFYHKCSMSLLSINLIEPVNDIFDVVNAIKRQGSSGLIKRPMINNCGCLGYIQGLGIITLNQ
ncbi:protein of unknown function [Shewanella benthica]|uniref:Uncharacterized protein n=1 Tax=Shewanella benthica TaxID=43661 RepID=A0A330LZN2_9GAMM|nr:protein of unknown function [Shewanella benthica]